MKEILNRLFEHQTLGGDEAKDILLRISEGEGTDAQLAAFMTVYLMRSITPEELAGFRAALMELCLDPKLPTRDAIDLCGTGGDAKNTFNISTLASFVVAGAGGKVIKHGNYGVSSISGSSNVLEHLGYLFSNDTDHLNHTFEQAGMCFLHAPLFHPALKRVGPVRKQLGIKTFFNMLGPLVNPARPKYRITGVFNLELARRYHYICQQTDETYIVLHTLDGYDELSLTAPVKLFSKNGEQVLSPADMGFKTLEQAAIFGGDSVEDAARIFSNVLYNQATEAQQSVVVANAALALQCMGLFPVFEDAVAASVESLKAGKALASFQTLLNS
ncbi:MAG: anthranilate phosphoribosyltransferase [Saprospiraceae bacterium]|nr:anthranilate phosphoribosyltransferase [Saprospiraceae bacterium]